MSNIIPIGTIVKPWGKVVAIGFTKGERYYWFVDDNCVSMIPAFMVEAPVAQRTELLTSNQQVAGSSPAGRTRK